MGLAALSDSSLTQETAWGYFQGLCIEGCWVSMDGRITTWADPQGLRTPTGSSQKKHLEFLRQTL